MGIDVKLVTHNYSVNSDFLNWAKFPIIPVLSGISSNPSTRLSYALPNVKNIGKIIRSSRLSPNKILVNSSIDISFSTYFSVGTKLKIGYNVLGNNPQDFTFPFYRLLDKIAAKTIVSKILAHTETHKRGYAAIGVDAKRIRVIPHCIDIDRIEKMSHASDDTIKPSKLTIFYCGRLHEEKGIRTLLDSYTEVSKKIESRLVIIGKGPLEKFVLKKKLEIERNSNGSRIDYLGWQSPSFFLSKMREADIVVVPSYVESFGLVILEAMSLKKPVIAASVGGIPEIVTDQVNDMLVKSHDVQGLRRALTTLLNDTQKRADISKRAFETVINRYSVEKIAPQFVDFMNDSDD